MLVDSHCHLDRLDKDKVQLQEIIKNANAKGVEHFLCVCVSVNDYKSMMDMISGLPNVYATCGVHPLHQDEACSKSELYNTANTPEVVAIGETGLDYHYSPESKQIQLTSFEEHIQVANELGKPLIIHTRDARQDTIDLLKANNGEQCGGVLHCFTESWEMAKAAIDLGFYISISGIVTFRNASELREVVKKIPLDRLLIETDSPWLAPVPHRGKQNEPAFVRDVAQFIADLKAIPLEKLAQTTTDNFFNLFPLTKEQTPQFA